MVGSGPEAVADFAGRYFDFSTSFPSLARLTFWEGLERGDPIDAERRALLAANKAAEIRRALPAISEAAAEDLLLTIVTLCHAWVAVPNVRAVITRRRTGYAGARRSCGLLSCSPGTSRAWDHLATDEPGLLGYAQGLTGHWPTRPDASARAERLPG
ncbi:hypothetical protein ASF98_07815 [Arthrobacter sp. Leaf337]|nr:hypothetical protein ASF98_07815 [Arthrobacter sp. Leaf337]